MSLNKVLFFLGAFCSLSGVLIFLFKFQFIVGSIYNLIIPIVLFVLGVLFLIISNLKTEAELSHTLNSFLFDTLPISLFYSFIIILLLFNFILVVFAMTNFNSIITILKLDIKSEQISEIQIFISIFLGGSLGGFLRITNTIKEAIRLNNSSLVKVAFEVIFDILKSSIFAIAFYGLFRAGIVKSINIDTLNIYGLIAFSVFIGYISDRLGNKVHFLYSTILKKNTDE